MKFDMKVHAWYQIQPKFDFGIMYIRSKVKCLGLFRKVVNFLFIQSPDVSNLIPSNGRTCNLF